jgi:arylformamidase
MKRKWIDITVPLHSGMVHWPGDPPVVIRRISSIEEGARSNVSLLRMSAHTGTHVDAPLHFLRGGRPMDAMPVEALIGPARVIAIRHPERVTVEELEGRGIRRGERILLKTRGSAERWKRDAFDPNYVYIPQEAARFLVQRGVRVVGVDYLSVGGYRKDSLETHQTLLKAGIWIVEGLNLAGVGEGRYDFICLPLRIAGGDGAPARALIRPRP